MSEERVQKILAQAGFGSRRDCEELIAAGRVIVNGKVIILGTKADQSVDKIQVDHKPIPRIPQKVYIALNKPRHVLSAINQEDGRTDVLKYVPNDVMLFPVGRLDFDSEGLIFLTNDGDFANKMAHPRYEHEKEYLVEVGKRPDSSQLEIWRRGVVLEDGYRTAPANVDVIETLPDGAWLRVILKEGRKRQIRETGARIGLPVFRIKRIRIGSVKLGTLKTGEWRYLGADEVQHLLGGAIKKTSRKPELNMGPDRSTLSKKDGGSDNKKIWRGTNAGNTVKRTSTKRSATISSERIRPDTSSSDKTPWRSSSSSVGRPSIGRTSKVSEQRSTSPSPTKARKSDRKKSPE